MNPLVITTSVVGSGTDHDPYRPDLSEYEDVRQWVILNSVDDGYVVQIYV